MSEFDRALQKVLLSEGGYSNNPKDPGGATMKGVTQRVYDAYRKLADLPPQGVQAITDAELQAIYKSQYWDKFDGDQMPAGVSYVVFDGAVNSGVAQSVKWLQRALGAAYTGSVDGIVGAGTLAALAGDKNNDALIAEMEALRMIYLRDLKTWPTFGDGWTSRVKSVVKIGQAWATGAEATDVTLDTAGASKAPVEDAAIEPATAAPAVTVTEAGPVIAPPAPDAVPFTVDQIKAFQADLKAKGYIEVGKADGIIGKNTLSAITAFEIAQGLPVSGQLTQSLWDALKAAPMRPVSVERANATTQTLVDDGQPAIKPAMNLQKVGMGIMATMGLGAVSQGGEIDLEKAMTFSSKAQSILAMLGHLGPWLVGAGVGGAILYFSTGLVQRLVADYRKGTLR